MKDYGCGLVMADGSFCESFEGTLNLCSHCHEAFLKRVEQLENAQQSMHRDRLWRRYAKRYSPANFHVSGCAVRYNRRQVKQPLESRK